MKIRQDTIQHIFRNKYTYSNGGVGGTINNSGNGTDERIDKWFYEDEDGNLHSKLNFASDYGLTAYAQGERDIATIMGGVVTDETTITKEGGILKVIGDIGGGVSSWDDLTDKPSWITDSKPLYSWNEINEKPSTFTPSSHNHNISDITNLKTTLDSKANSSHTHTISNITDLQDSLDNKSNVGHTHSISNITNLQTTLDGKANKIHTHNLSDITNLQFELDEKANKSYVDDNFVTISTEQNISGVKHFTNGVSIGSNKHKVYEDNGVVYIDGDVAVTGGLTAYAQGERSVSTIMDGVTVDGTTITKENGVLKIVGDIGGVSSWDDLTDKPSWITDSKPLYSWNEITSKPTSFTPSSHNHTISNITDLQDCLDGKANITHTHNYASTVKVGATSYNVSSNVISLPAYPTIPSTIKNPYSLTISLNGTSQGAYDGSAAKSINITANSVGAAASSHNHSWSNITSGIPATATRWPTITEVASKENLIIKLNGGTTEGTNQFTYNATAAKSINITPSSIGAAASAHSHSWANITSGKPTTLSGYGITDGVNAVTVSGSGNAITTASISGHTLTLTKGSTFSLSTHNHNSSYVASLGTSGNYLTWTKNGTTNNITVPYATNSNGTAKLLTTRTIWGQSFNGEQNVSGNMTGVGSITASGNIVTQGGITCYSSDERTKEIIEDINISLSDIANSPTVKFKWNDTKIKDDGKIHIGGIAQYTQKILPEAIVEENDILNMDYASTAYIYAVQTAKHLQDINNKILSKIEELEKKIIDLNKQLLNEKNNPMVH